MNKTFCDICGEEITHNQKVDEYKIKKTVYVPIGLGDGITHFHKPVWEYLIVHATCYNKLCEYIRDERKKNNIQDDIL